MHSNMRSLCPVIYRNFFKKASTFFFIFSFSKYLEKVFVVLVILYVSENLHHISAYSNKLNKAYKFHKISWCIFIAIKKKWISMTKIIIVEIVHHGPPYIRCLTNNERIHIAELPTATNRKQKKNIQEVWCSAGERNAPRTHSEVHTNKKRRTAWHTTITKKILFFCHLIFCILQHHLPKTIYLTRTKVTEWRRLLRNVQLK